MARRKKYTQPKPKPGRKPKVRRQRYTLAIKEKARAWHKHDNLGATEVKKEMLEEHNITVALSTSFLVVSQNSVTD